MPFLALLCAYPLKDRMGKRVVLVLSSIPISIVVNGFRIGMIEVLVEWYRQGLLIMETWVFSRTRVRGDRSSFIFI